VRLLAGLALVLEACSSGSDDRPDLPSLDREGRIGDTDSYLGGDYPDWAPGVPLLDGATVDFATDGRTVQLSTPAPFDEVAAFYVERLGPSELPAVSVGDVVQDIGDYYQRSPADGWELTLIGGVTDGLGEEPAEATLISLTRR